MPICAASGLRTPAIAARRGALTRGRAPGSMPAPGGIAASNFEPVRDVTATQRADADLRKSPAPAGGRKMLVVDDSVFLCNALKRELHADGIEVVATQSGWTALGLLEKTHFDAILVDLMMPAMPGEELVARLEQLVPTIPCIILTGNATRERVAALARRPNIAAIPVKPWEHDRLISTITSAIAKSRQ
jgi:CheY-like chemotaxis protein